MDPVSHAYHVEDIGRIILGAQEELKDIRRNLQPNADASVTQNVEDVLFRAEADLRAKADIVLSGMINNSMNVLPPVSKITTLKEKIPTKSLQTEDGGVRRVEAKKDEVQDIMTQYGIPNAPANRKPHENKKGDGRRRPKRTTVRMRQKVSQNQHILPQMNRDDPSAPRPNITEQDANGGVLNLLNRGFLPSGIDLTPAFQHGDTMISNRPIKLHDKSELKFKTIPYLAPNTFNVATLRFDLADISSEAKQKLPASQLSLKEPRKAKTISLEFPEKEQINEKSLKNNPDDKKQLLVDAPADGLGTVTEIRENVDRIRGYNELLDTYSLHQFIIRKGKVLADTPEFISFERIYAPQWGAITSILNALENLFTKYSIPTAYIDGQQVVRLASDALVTLSESVLLSCVLNADQVNTQVHRPGARYLGEDRIVAAATKIVATARMKLTRVWFKKRCTTQLAALNIQTIWKVFSGYRQLQKKLKGIRNKQEDTWVTLMNTFREGWNEIKTKKRVIVHIPSISVESKCRQDMINFTARENLQMIRLCAISDPLVDVVYVSPFNVSDEVKGYYIRMLELGGVENASTRIRILTPENINRFPDHFSLSSILLYSPYCMRRIKRIVRGKNAYLVMGALGPTDKRVAMALNIPILGADPEQAVFYSTLSGAKRVFAESDVNIPIGAYDIYTKEDLVSTLAKLVVSNMEISQWMIKLDDDFEETGFAVIDMDKLQVVKSIRNEKKENEANDPLYWKDADILEDARSKIEHALEKFIDTLATLCFPEIYSDWGMFMTSLTQVGAVLEAIPVHHKGYFRTNLFIEPTGTVHVLSTHDRVVNANNVFGFIACSFPQTVVPYEAARGASMAIGSVLYTKGVIGYVTIDFRSHLDSKRSKNQKLWALKISPYLTNSAMSFVLFHYLLQGRYHPTTGKYHIQLEKEDLGVSTNQNALTVDEGFVSDQTLVLGNIQGPERSYLCHEYIYHPNLSTMQYASFFNACRLNGVCFDLQNLVGTSFMLSDSLAGGVIGVISFGKNENESARYAGSALELICKEVGSHGIPNQLDGGFLYGNFKDILATSRKMRAKSKKQSTRRRS